MTTATTNHHEVIIDGKSITRNSEKHVYTHAVVGFRVSTGALEVFGWCGSAELARKLVQKYQSTKKPKYGSALGNLFRSVQAVTTGSTINIS